MDGLEIRIGETPPTLLYAEQLRDGRVALGTRTRRPDGEWRSGELHVLEPSAYLALAAWLAQPSEHAWIGPVRERQPDQLRTAGELYGAGPAAAQRLLDDVLHEIPRPLLLRALLMLVNSLGPAEHDRRVARLNAAPPGPHDDELRRQLAEQREGFAYAVAAAALLDALERGLLDEDEDTLG